MPLQALVETLHQNLLLGSRDLKVMCTAMELYIRLALAIDGLYDLVINVTAGCSQNLYSLNGFLSLF